MGLDCLPSKVGDSVFVDSLYTSDFDAVSSFLNAALIVISSLVIVFLRKRGLIALPFFVLTFL